MKSKNSKKVTSEFIESMMVENFAQADSLLKRLVEAEISKKVAREVESQELNEGIFDRIKSNVASAATKVGNVGRTVGNVAKGAVAGATSGATGKDSVFNRSEMKDPNQEKLKSEIASATKRINADIDELTNRISKGKFGQAGQQGLQQIKTVKTQLNDTLNTVATGGSTQQPPPLPPKNTSQQTTPPNSGGQPQPQQPTTPQPNFNQNIYDQFVARLKTSANPQKTYNGFKQNGKYKNYLNELDKAMQDTVPQKPTPTAKNAPSGRKNVQQPSKPSQPSQAELNARRSTSESVKINSNLRRV